MQAQKAHSESFEGLEGDRKINHGEPGHNSAGYKPKFNRCRGFPASFSFLLTINVRRVILIY
jgi:hypothetical protein